MRERPILFSAPMVQAVLAGRKTVTRRLVTEHVHAEADSFLVRRCGGMEVLVRGLPVGDLRNRFGLPGDRLWVKETWRPEASSMRHRMGWKITYAADGAVLFSDLARVDASWRRPKAAARGNVSPLLMPRWASRLTLEVVSVRVERLHDITAEDALAEGLTRLPSADTTLTWWGAAGKSFLGPRRAFEHLWDSINGEGAWNANPWVWRVEFKRVGAAT